MYHFFVGYYSVLRPMTVRLIVIKVRLSFRLPSIRHYTSLTSQCCTATSRPTADKAIIDIRLYVTVGPLLPPGESLKSTLFCVATLKCPLCANTLSINPEVSLHKKGKGSTYSTAESRVPELIPVLGSQPVGDVSHKPGGRLPIGAYFPPCLQLPSQPLRGLLHQFRCSVNTKQRHDGCEQFA